MNSKQIDSLARNNQLEEFLVERHRHKTETGEDLPLPPLDQLTGKADLSLKGDRTRPYRSLNALRHGLSGQTVLMPWEDRQEYDSFCRRFLEDLAPVGFEQTQLAQTVADCQWRLNRASAYESAIYHYHAFLGHYGIQDNDAVEDEIAKARLAEQTEKHLLNISLYESRLQRKMMNARKALKELQSEQRPKGALGAQPEPVAPTVVAQVAPAASAPAAQPRSENLPPIPDPPPAEGPVDFVFSDLEVACPVAPVPGSWPPASKHDLPDSPGKFANSLK
jgi:hypothetical protein